MQNKQIIDNILKTIYYYHKVTLIGEEFDYVTIK